MPDLSSSRHLGTRFKAIRRIASGGMGEVWLAHDNEFDIELVVKLARRDAPGISADLLRQEFRIAKKLVHENILRVYELHEVDHEIFYTAEYVNGGDIGQLRGGSLTVILETVGGVVDALEYAHAAGVIHRDLKCSNILLDRQGCPRVGDFGVAGLLEPSGEDLQVVGGGSRINQSPQQSSGEPPAVADDIYGLGTLLFELIAGEPAFSNLASIEDRYGCTAARLSSACSVPAEVDDLVASMLSRRSSERPSDMTFVREALRESAAVISTTDGKPKGRPVTPIRISAPPRALEARTAAASISAQRVKERVGSGWSPGRVMTVLAFGLLGLLVVGVFVFLPDWVRENPQVIDLELEASEDVDEGVGERAEPGESARIDLERAGSDPTELKRPVPDLKPEEIEPGEIRSSPVVVSAAEPPAPDRDFQSAKPNPLPEQSPLSIPQATRRTSGVFSEAMSAGLRALDRKSFSEAQTAFQRALATRPDSREAADGLARADQQMRLAAIESHRARARELASTERWREAETEYRAVLMLDPAIRFAIEGQRLASERADLSDRLDYHIIHPDRFSTQLVLNEAIDLLGQARDALPEGPRIRRQITQLEQVIEVASTPVQIRLVSDNYTDVVVYRVGSLGRFEQRQLELRPGSYTAVGSREGYRDVRRVFKVSPGEKMDPVVVRCEEKI
jgi:serine/threonine protein kinase